VILAVAANPALDLTYQLESLVPGEVNRVTAVTERAGGKGLNIARILHAAGVPVRVLAPVGGATGARVRALLSAEAVPHALVEVPGDTRRTVVLTPTVDPAVAGAQPLATGLWEPGPQLTPHDWTRFVAAFRAALPDTAVVTLSGSLPRGWPVDGYAQLIALASAAGTPVILDASGPALRAGIAAGPALVKPNAAELAELVAAPIDDVSSALAAVAGLGGQDMVVSLGALGAVASVADAAWHACPPPVSATNPTGAGDALVAALAHGLLLGTPWPARLGTAVAWSAAAAAHPVAGELEPALAAQLLPHVRVAQVRAGGR